MRKNNENIRYNYNVMDSNKSFFYVILLNVLAPLVFYVCLLALLLLKNVMGQSLYEIVYGLLLAITSPTLLIVLITIYHKKNNIDLKTATNFSWRLDYKYICLIVLMLAVTIVGFFPIINMLYTVLSNIGIDASGSVGFAMNNWWQLIIGVFIYCLLPAVAEEIVFRGMILKGASDRAKPIVAITISALSFFLMHGSLAQTFYQIILGFVLSLICYYTKNVFYPIIFHFLNNLAVILMSYFGIGGFLNGFSLTFGGFMAGIGLAVAGAGAIFGLFVLIRHLSKKNSGNFEFVVADNNIIIEEKHEKLGFKAYLNSFNIDERFYCYTAWVVAVIIWLFNSI